MKYYLMIAALSLLMACGGVKPQTELAWTTDSLQRASDSTLLVHLVYPVLTDSSALADSVNQTVEKVLQSSFEGLDSLQGDYTLMQRIDSIQQQKNSDEITRKIPYTFISNGSVYRYGDVVSVWLERYLFTRGAHGMTFSEFYNFDYNNGKRLAVAEIFDDTTKLSQLNRDAFGKFLTEQGITDVDQALFVSPDQLPLPKNVGFDSTGVVMRYNQYEIAPYAMGILSYSLPYDQVKSLLR